MKPTCFLLLILFHAYIAPGQKTDDTTSSKAPTSWKRPFAGIRLAVGFQKSFYYEAGFSLQQYAYDEKRGYAANCFYIAYERTTANGEKPVQGIKAGFESVFNGGTGGIELKYLSDALNRDWVITPKIGIGIGAATLFYGYNLSTNKRPFSNLGKHQFSLAVNTNILFYHWKYKEW